MQISALPDTLSTLTVLREFDMASNAVILISMFPLNFCTFPPFLHWESLFKENTPIWRMVRARLPNLDEIPAKARFPNLD